MKFNPVIALVAAMLGAQRIAAVSWEQWDAIDCDGDASMNAGAEDEGFHCIVQQGRSVSFSFGEGDPCMAEPLSSAGVTLYTDESCTDVFTDAGPGCWNFAAASGGSIGFSC
jgi:hypothetical protein